MNTLLKDDRFTSAFTELAFEKPQENYSEALRAALEKTCAWTPLPNAPDAYGIYLATDNAGADESVSFWKEALEKTPSFANPANFPWTLANAPASFIARLYGIQGPVYTFVGNEEAVTASLAQAAIDLENQVVSEAWVIKLEIKAKQVKVKLLRLSGTVTFEELDDMLSKFV